MNKSRALDLSPQVSSELTSTHTTPLAGGRRRESESRLFENRILTLTALSSLQV